MKKVFKPISGSRYDPAGIRNIKKEAKFNFDSLFVRNSLSNREYAQNFKGWVKWFLSKITFIQQ